MVPFYIFANLFHVRLNGKHLDSHTGASVSDLLRFLTLVDVDEKI